MYKLAETNNLERNEYCIFFPQFHFDKFQKASEISETVMIACFVLVTGQGIRKKRPTRRRL